MKKYRVGFIIAAVTVFWFSFCAYRSDKKTDGVVVRQIECDFYSKDAMYVSPGSTRAMKRKECERKFYGYTDDSGVKVFNLGGRNFNVKGYLGFVLHSDEELVAPKSYRGAADIYVLMPMRHGVAREKSDLRLKISYIDWDYVVDEKGLMGKNVVKRNNAASVDEYLYGGLNGWVAATYIFLMGDGKKMKVSCSWDRVMNIPYECIVYREIMPRYVVEYKVNWSDVPDWHAFDNQVQVFVFSMMGDQR